MRFTKQTFEDFQLVEVRTAWRTVNIEMQFWGKLLTFREHSERPRVDDAIRRLPFALLLREGIQQLGTVG
jgi:hypothetical protein